MELIIETKGDNLLLYRYNEGIENTKRKSQWLSNEFQTCYTDAVTLSNFIKEGIKLTRKRINFNESKLIDGVNKGLEDYNNTGKINCGPYMGLIDAIKTDYFIEEPILGGYSKHLNDEGKLILDTITNSYDDLIRNNNAIYNQYDPKHYHARQIQKGDFHNPYFEPYKSILNFKGDIINPNWIEDKYEFWINKVFITKDMEKNFKLWSTYYKDTDDARLALLYDLFPQFQRLIPDQVYLS